MKSLILEGHDRVHSAQYNQSQRNRDVQQKPEEQSAMQTLLFLELACLVADVLQIVDSGMGASGKQRTHAGKTELRFAGVGKQQAALGGPLKKRPDFVQIESAKRSAFFFGKKQDFRGSGDCGASRGGSHVAECGRACGALNFV